uniref:Transposase n=1 Tax=Thermosporothrix sp. COM3 TaxID=2490863 RepID=A0A455SJZ5_9CHLR|nr:transposase [Thermosporothrix sp. COM3]
MDRTIILHLQPNSEQAQVLQRTLQAHTDCFNAVAQEGFTTSCHNGVELHKRTYYPLRATHPDLPAQLVCAARVKATEAVKSALDRRKKGRKASTPRARLCPIRYDQRSYWVKWETMTCSLATTGGRVELPFVVPPYAAKYIGGKVCSADLCYRKGRYTLHVVVSIPDPVVAPSGKVVGVDLGLNRPAVTSNKQFLGERRWKEQERRIFRLKRKLQAKGTKSAKRHLRKLSGKLLRQRKDHDHVLSKRIVAHTPAGSTIVVENLTHIRSRARMKKKTETQRRLHSWSFAQFHAFLTYKAQEKGIRVVKVDPRHTSQTCSRCGHQARKNRRSQSLFLCRECGYCLNADLNASQNIREKYLSSLASLGIPLVGGSSSSGLSSQPLVG